MVLLELTVKVTVELPENKTEEKEDKVYLNFDHTTFYISRPGGGSAVTIAGGKTFVTKETPDEITQQIAAGGILKKAGCKNKKEKAARVIKEIKKRKK